MWGDNGLSLSAERLSHDEVGCEGLAVILLLPRAVARLLRTWLFLQILWICCRLALQLVQMCLRVAGVGQREQVGSSPYQWRFFGGEITSSVGGMMNVMLLASISQSFFS